MPAFQSRRWQGGNILHSLNPNRNPAVFGFTFVAIIVAASFGLSSLTSTRYELHERKVTQVPHEEELNKKRRKLDIREEYIRLQAGGSYPADDDWEPIRVPRPEGVAEWGSPPSTRSSR